MVCAVDCLPVSLIVVRPEAAPGSKGNTSENVEPCFVEVAQIRPPWAETTNLQIARPRPPPERSLALPYEVYCSKIASSQAGSIPGPESLISIRYALGGSAESSIWVWSESQHTEDPRISISPDRGVNLHAFSSRLISSCSICGVSKNIVFSGGSIRNSTLNCFSCAKEDTSCKA